MSGPVDVLGAIDIEISVHAGRMSTRQWERRWPYAREHHTRLVSVRAAVAELIAADVEYDAAWLEFKARETFTTRLQLEMAVARRAAALAAVTKEPT